VNGASTSDVATPVAAPSNAPISSTGIAILSSFLIIFVVAAIFAVVYIRRRRSNQRSTSVQAAFNQRRSFSAERAELVGFPIAKLTKSNSGGKATSTPKRAVHPHLTLSKIGAPVFIKATTDQEVLDTAIPAGSANMDNSLMAQLGFESAPVSPRASEFGNIPLGEMAESRVSSDHMRVRHHARDPSFDFSKIDPSASMGGVSSNYLIASPQSAVPHNRSRWEDSGMPFGRPF
jgi:hypothetical protein